MHKKVYKAVKKAAEKKWLRRGVKEVVKALRKGEKGLCVIAGDIAPIDVISHIPVFCEEQEVPYIFVNSKADLGAAGNTKRPTSVVLISTKDGEVDKLGKLVESVKDVAPKY
jgi:H/ACA ribonucleoprotein complex subunit 2